VRRLRVPPSVALVLLASNGVYVTRARRQTCLECEAAVGVTRSLRLDLSSSRRGRRYARIGTGPKSVVAKTLNGCIAKTGRKRRLLAGRNETPVDASPHPSRRRYSACY
jgi:hypothetical protein